MSVLCSVTQEYKKYDFSKTFNSAVTTKTLPQVELCTRCNFIVNRTYNLVLHLPKGGTYLPKHVGTELMM